MLPLLPLTTALKEGKQLTHTTSRPITGATPRRSAPRKYLASSRTVFLVVLVSAAVAGAWPAAAFAATQPALGTALNYTVLSGQTITNTGPSVITGNLGLDPGSSVTGFPPGSVTGTQDVSDAASVLAQNDLVTGYTDAANSPSTSDLTGKDLGGQNLTPGVYSFSSSAQLTGSLTLSGNGVFIFQIGSALTTASNSAVLLVNGAQACAVYWQVGSSATLGSAANFQGNLMALSSITMVTGANLTGRALARNGALTLDTNNITPPSGTCTVATATSTTGSGSTTGGSGSTDGSGTTNASTPGTGSAAPDALLLPGILLLLAGGGTIAVDVRRGHRAR